MWPGRPLAVPDRDRDRALEGHHVTAGEDARAPGHQVGADGDDAVLDDQAGHALEQREVGVLAEGEDQGVGVELVELARGLGEARLVELHPLDDEPPGVDLLDRGQPGEEHALVLRLGDLGLVGRHPVLRPAVDHDRLGRAEPLGGPCRVHRGVAAAVDRHPPAQQRLLARLDVAQHVHGVEHVGGRAGGDVGPLAELGADGEEDRVVLAADRVEVGDLGVELEGDPEVEDALHLGVQHVAGEAVAGDAEAHHAAGHRARLLDGHVVAGQGEVVGRSEAGRAGADDEHPPARGRGGHGHRPALLDGGVADEALDRVDADRLVELAAVAGRLAGVVADAAHDGGEGVVLHDPAPGTLVAGTALLGLVEPALDVLTRGAGVVAGRHPVRVDGTLGAPGARLVGPAGADVQGDRERLVHHSSPSGSSPKRAMLRSARAWIRATMSGRGWSPKRCA